MSTTPDRILERIPNSQLRLQKPTTLTKGLTPTLLSLVSLFRLATGIGEGQQESATTDRREAKLEKAKQEDESTKLQKVILGEA